MSKQVEDFDGVSHNQSKGRRTVAVDFDGVLHSYVQQWTRADVIQDPPTPGAIAWLNHLAVNEIEPVIVSTRAASSEGQSAIRNWLLRHGCAIAMTIKITDQKPPAILYIDDRAWLFTGDNFPTVKSIRDFQPWNHELRESARAQA